MDYKQSLKDVTAKIDALLVEHSTFAGKTAEIEQEIRYLNEIQINLAPLAGEKVVPNEFVTEIVQTAKQSQDLDVGITERVRQVLASKAGAVFLPSMVRIDLESLKYDLSKHTNVMATIHSVLKRLVQQGKVETVVRDDGKTGYTFKPLSSK